MSITNDESDIKRVEIDGEVYVSVDDILSICDILQENEECQRVAESIKLAIMILL